jgi:hypothetical protein
VPHRPAQKNKAALIACIPRRTRGIFFFTYFYEMKIWTFIILLALIACKNKKKETEENGSFPVLPIIKSQVAHVDSSLYSIVKTLSDDSTRDTIYLKREQFRDAAKDFLSIPDITQPKWKDKYKESKLYDENLQMVVLDYTTDDPEAEVRSEKVYIEQGEAPEGKVKTIVIDRITKDGNNIIQQNMIWEMDSHFQVASNIESPGKPDRTKIVKVTWSGFPPEK